MRIILLHFIIPKGIAGLKTSVTRGPGGQLGFGVACFLFLSYFFIEEYSLRTSDCH